MATTGPRRLPVRFPEAAWAHDVKAASPKGAEVARAARRRYGRAGIPVSELAACQSEHHQGTRLPGCLKTYLPRPAGRFGMVFRFGLDDRGHPMLMFLAFGARHHPRASHAPTVYEIAHQRLHADRPGEP